MSTEGLTAAEAALEAARLGLISTITVGVLATLGTLAGTLLAPFLIRRSEAKSAAAQRRREELADVIPQVISKGMRGAGPNASADAMVASMEAHARLGVLLRPDEWQIAAIAKDGLMSSDGSTAATKSAGVAATVIPMWARGEVTSEQAAAIYARDAGKKVTRPTPP